MSGSDATVVLRMGSLGDIVLSASVTAALAPVVYVTRDRWVDVARRLPGVVKVVGWPRDPLPVRPERVVDLQADVRARLLTMQMSPTRVDHVQRHDWQRRARVWWKARPAPRVIDRYVRAAGLDVPSHPWLERSPVADHVVFVPGARWATKRWPMAQWIALGQAWKTPIVVLGGPGDVALVEEIASAIGPRAKGIAESGFEQCWSLIGSARAVVAGDTGLMHVAGAMGVPLVALFGPTTAEDGFWCHDGVVVAADMGCRPCSRHGGTVCPLEHHACMTELAMDRVRAALSGVVEGSCGISC